MYLFLLQLYLKVASSTQFRTKTVELLVNALCFRGLEPNRYRLSHIHGFAFASPHLGEHLVHGILRIVGIHHHRECHAIHQRIVVFEQVFILLFTVVHKCLFCLYSSIRLSKGKTKYPYLQKRVIFYYWCPLKLLRRIHTTGKSISRRGCVKMK